MSGSIDELLEIMAALRDPETGCPWDVKQDFSTIAPYTIEEAYEVSDAIQRGDMSELREELGDLLLQVVFHAQMASEMSEFDFHDVAAAISSKMIERHPHVFERSAAIGDAELREAWEARKETERRRKGGHDSALDGVARALPALLRAHKLTRRAARQGLDWASPEDAFSKCREELEELQTAAERPDERGALEEELGDLLFACAGLGRQLGLDPEKALRGANDKFENRYRGVEAALRERGGKMTEASPDDLAVLWEQSKID